MTKTKNIIDVWFLTKDGILLVREIKHPVAQLLDTEILTIKSESLTSCLDVFTKETSVKLNIEQCEEFIYQKNKDELNNQIEEIEYIYYISNEEKEAFAKLKKWKLINYRDVQDIIYHYNQKTDHFYDVFYTLLDKLEHQFNRYIVRI